MPYFPDGRQNVTFPLWKEGDPGTNFTIEIALYADELYVQNLNNKGQTTFRKKLEYLITQWNGVSTDLRLQLTEAIVAFGQLCCLSPEDLIVSLHILIILWLNIILYMLCYN